MVRRFRWPLILFGLLAIAVVVLGVSDILQARSLTNDARAEIERAVALAEEGEFEVARAGFEGAVATLDSSLARIDSPSASIVGAVPFVHTEIRAGVAGVAAVREASLAILEVLDFLVAERPPLLESGRINSNAMALLEASRAAALEHAIAAQRIVANAPSPRLRAVKGPLAEVVDTSAAMVDVLTGAQPLIAGISSAAMGDAPFRTLILFENGAELRATGGLMGVFALLEIDDGLVSVASTYALGPRDPSGEFVSVAAPADYMRRYGGFLANTTLWSNVNLSPDFPTVADIAARLYHGATGIAPDLVARIDLVALGYLLEAYTEIFVDGAPLEADALATDFLVDSYQRFSEDEQAVYVASVVAQVFGQMVDGAAADITLLTRSARRAIGERRIALFMRDDEVDRLFARADVIGAVQAGGPGDVEVVVQNFAANKIDIFTKMAIAVDIKATGCTVEGEMTITLQNGVPPEAIFPAAGGIGNSGRWWVSFYLPSRAEIVDMLVDGEPTGGTTDVEFGRTVASVLAGAEPGDAVSATIRWQEGIVEQLYRLRLQPQPLVNPATLVVNGGDTLALRQTQTTLISTSCGG